MTDDYPDWLQDGPIISREEVDPGTLLSDYFDIHRLGVEVCHPDPPKKAWEALVLYLAGNNDELSWQVGATCNRYPKKYHADIYGWFATLLSRSPRTIEQWAHVERSIPTAYRVHGLSIWFHKAVAKLDNPAEQQYHLNKCKDNGWPLTEFENYLALQGIKQEQEHYQSDHQFEQDRAIYNMANELADTKRQLAETQSELAKVVTSQEPGPGPDPYTPTPVSKALGIIKSFLPGREWACVIVHRDGRVEWIPGGEG